MIIFHSSSTLQFIKTKKNEFIALHGFRRLKNGQGGRWPFLNDFIFSIWNGRRLKNFRPSINLALKSTYFCFFENCISLFPSSDGEWRRNLPLGFKARHFSVRKWRCFWLLLLLLQVSENVLFSSVLSVKAAIIQVCFVRF